MRLRKIVVLHPGIHILGFVTQAIDTSLHTHRNVVLTLEERWVRATMGDKVQLIPLHVIASMFPMDDEATEEPAAPVRRRIRAATATA